MYQRKKKPLFVTFLSPLCKAHNIAGSVFNTHLFRRRVRNHKRGSNKSHAWRNTFIFKKSLRSPSKILQIKICYCCMGAHCSYFNVKLKAHICFVWNIHCFSLDLYIFTSLLCVFTTTHSFNSAVMRAFSGCTDTSPEILFSSPLKALFAEFMDSVFHSTAREEYTHEEFRTYGNPDFPLKWGKQCTSFWIQSMPFCPRHIIVSFYRSWNEAIKCWGEF